MAPTMQVLVGTAAGLVDAGSGDVVAFHGRDVGPMSDNWVVLDGRLVCTVDGTSGVTVEGPRVTCLAARPDVPPWVGTAEAHLYRLGAGAQRVDAFEEVEGRDGWYTPWGGPPDLRSLSLSPGGTVLANVHVGGILRSVDDGASWHPTIDLDHDVHQVLALDGGTAVAACAHGLAISSDEGTTWELVDEGLHATYSRAVAVCGDTLLLSVSSGPQGSRAALYRRPLEDGDGPGFERCRQGLPEDLAGNVDTFWLAGAADGTAAFATRSGDVHLSTDEGVTWEQVASGLPPVRCVALG